MTSREFYNAIKDNESVARELREFAESEIVKLDARNEKRKNTKSKAQVANDEIKDKILELLAEKPMVASDIGKALDISTQKASALAKLIVDDGKATVSDMKVKGKGTVKLYTIA